MLDHGSMLDRGAVVTRGWATLCVTSFFGRGVVCGSFDFFFPEQAQTSHLLTIAKNDSFTPRRVSGGDHTSEIKDLQEDVSFLTLVIVALLRRSSKTETASLADVQDLLDEIDEIDEIDGLDGVAGSGLDPGVLRGLLGVMKESDDRQDRASNEEFKIVTTSRYRRR